MEFNKEHIERADNPEVRQLAESSTKVPELDRSKAEQDLMQERLEDAESVAPGREVQSGGEEQSAEEKSLMAVESDSAERTSLDAALAPFEQTNWDNLSQAEKEKAVETLRDSIAEDLQLEGKPNIAYYNSETPGDYGGYAASTNTIYINRCNMGDAAETADTIAHESRHCWQHERANLPESQQTDQDKAFKESLEHYSRPEDNYESYSNQLVETDACEYAKTISSSIRHDVVTDTTPNAQGSDISYGPSYREMNPEKGTVFDNDKLPEDLESKKLEHYEVVDGMVGGRIPVKEYEDIVDISLHNRDSDTITLGKFEPAIREDGSKDYSTPGPNSYNAKAEASGDTYFSLGSEWDNLTNQYDIDNEDMFELFNKPALDDAIQAGKEIRFSHNPENYEGSALFKEWEYLQNNGYTKLKEKEGYWYAK